MNGIHSGAGISIAESPEIGSAVVAGVDEVDGEGSAAFGCICMKAACYYG